MSEIEIGEYIRTKQGYIAKLENKSDKYLMFNNPIYCYYEESPLLPINEELLDGRHIKAKEYITKHSFNIIDLIEEGDIVCIKDIMYDGEYKSEVFENFDNILCINNSEGDEIIELNENIENKQIELLSILTHELYEQNCYKVVE